MGTVGFSGIVSSASAETVPIFCRLEMGRGALKPDGLGSLLLFSFSILLNSTEKLINSFVLMVIFRFRRQLPVLIIFITYQSKFVDYDKYYQIPLGEQDKNLI